jgi:hypothetical protein
MDGRSSAFEVWFFTGLPHANIVSQDLNSSESFSARVHSSGGCYMTNSLLGSLDDRV